MIRALDPATDRALVEAFFHEAADYILLERGQAPGPEVAEEYFTDTPPGCDAAASLRLGLFEGSRLVAVAEMAFGFPEPDAAFLGLMIVVPAVRGRGAGALLLSHLEAEARSRHCSALFLAVFEANPRGRAFWERQGFATVLTDRPITVGTKTQMARRMVKRLGGA